MQPPSFLRRAAPLLASLGLFASCQVVRNVTSDAPPPPNPDVVFSDLVRYADLTVMRLNVATSEFAAAVATPEAELQAATWRLDAQRYITQIVGGPSPIVGMLDMVVLGTVQRWVHEDYWIPEVWGEPDRPLAHALENTEKDGWTLLERYLDAKLVAEARKVLEGWRADNPRLTRLTLLDIPSFQKLASKQQESGGVDPDLLGMIGLDPLGGLEPMARQVELSRMLGQRMLFFVERASRLIGMEIDMRLLAARGTPELKQVLANLDEVTKSLASYAKTGESLPQWVAAEREATLMQVNATLDAQRAGFVQALETAEKPVREILAQSQATLDSTTRASTALTETVKAVDVFLAGFEKEEPAAAAPVPTEPAPPSKPFDIAEYGAAVDSLGGAARDLTGLLTTLDAKLPAVQKVLDETATRGEASLYRALVGVLVVGLALILAWALAVLFLRRNRSRSTPSGMTAT